MATERKKISIFIDTNVFQSFVKHNKRDYVFLSTLGVPKGYSELVRFIKDNQLQGFVEICISEVVFKEIKQHMINNFNSFYDAIAADIESYRKIAGDLLDCNYNIKLNKDNYSKYVNNLIKEFVDNPQNACKTIDVPSKDVLFDTLLDKSLRGVKPFVKQTIEGKEYKDAGFKDSIIAETIYDYCSKENSKCLFITNDVDFSQKFETILNETNDFVKCSSFDQAIECLKKYYTVSPEERLRKEFYENTYWHEYLLKSIEQEYDASVTNVKVDGVKQEEDGIFSILISMTLNETIYKFTVRFDAIANDIIDSECQIDND